MFFPLVFGTAVAVVDEGWILSPYKKLVGMNGIMTRTSTILAEHLHYPHPDLGTKTSQLRFFIR